MYKTYYDSRDKQTTHMIRCKPEDIEIVILGNTLHGSKRNGINGTFFDTPRPALEKSCWGLAVNEGKPIGANAFLTDWKGTKRGVVAWDGEKMICQRINRYTEIPNMVWGISGVMLIPEYSRTKEKYADDIYRKTNHTIIGYDKDYVYLIVRTNSTMSRLIQTCAFFGLAGAISLDGGGSTQLNYKGLGLKSSRKINSAVLIKG